MIGRQLTLLVLAVTLSLSGCARSSHRIRTVEFYGTGELQRESTSWHHDKLDPEGVDFACRTDYFRNGKPSAESWFNGGGLVRKLTFHENGRLKSAERLSNDEITYAVHYDQEGNIERQIGQPPRPPSPQADNPAPPTPDRLARGR